MHCRRPRHRRLSRIHTDHRRWIRPGEPIEDAHPQHRLSLGHVVSVQGDDVGVVDVGIGARLPITGERLLECRSGRRRAQPGVAVHVVGADATVADQRESVILLEEQLPGGVETDRTRPAFVEQLSGAIDDGIHRCVPIGFHEFATAPDQWPREPVRRMIGLPAEQILRVEPPVVDPIDRPSTHPRRSVRP